ncbi:MAG: two-component regulator propeller domain-containing protein [Bacteroidota bacterium]
MSITCMLQAPGAELWIGTTSGLVLFDGTSNVQRFSDKDGLNDNVVTALFMQSDNTLWIGHKNGKITLFKNKKFIPFPFNDKLSGDKVSSFTEANGMWIASYGAGLSFCSKDNQFKQFNSENGLSDDFVYTLTKDSKNDVWAGTDAGITHISTKKPSDPVFSVVSMKNGLPDNIVLDLVCDKNDDIWVAMQDSGVCRYDITENKFKHFKNISEWKYGTVTSLHFSSTGALFIGTKDKGVITYSINKDGKEFLRVIDIKNGLLSNEVNSVFVDREDNLWVGTTKGLSEMCQDRTSYLTTKNGLLSDKVFAFYVDRKDNYWIGTDKGLVKYSLLPDGETAIKNYFLTEGKLKKQITSIYEDNKGIIWLGTYGNGLNCFDPKIEKNENISQKQGLANDNVSSISADKKGNIWISTLGGGISRISFNNGNRSIKNYSSENGLPGDYIYCVFSDSENRLWIGTDGEGLVMFNGDSFVKVSEKNKLKGKTVYSITQDKLGKLWFSTSEEGIYKYDPVAGASTAVNYFFNNGLRDNNPQIVATSGNKVITAHSRGIDQLDISSGKVNYFSVSDNDIEPNLNASFVDKEGNIWVGTNSGVLKFRSADIPSDTVTPIVHLNSITVQYQSFPLDSTTNFSYRQNNFVFNFSTIWLRSNENIKIRYKLEGNDENYLETDNKLVPYSNLPSGNYTFSISASNGQGKWSPPLLYSFVIATPIWLRWWFWVLVIGSGASIIYFFIQYRLKALQREKRILEEKVTLRTKEISKQSKIIETKNLELERLSIVARETGNAIIIMDAQGRLEWVNYSFEKLNGMTLDEIRTLKGETIYEISNHPDITTMIDKCIREKCSVVYESKNLNKKGPVTWESSTLTPIYGETGNLQKLIIIDTDVTERKMNEVIIRQKNKDITDSIEYAKRIQTSILPSLTNIQQSLPKSFIFFLQKDIVSGDFYWFALKDDCVIIACVDCTGHGVPGAFMSLIGYNILNNIVNDNDIVEPGKILDELNKGVIKALYQNDSNNSSKDGMDIAICNINLKTNEIQFAGAMRPLYIFRKGEFEEVKGDKMSIGTKECDRDHEIKFTNKIIKADKGDVFYISSDGYADQFGGDNGKKMMTKNFKEILNTIKEKPFEEQHKLMMKHHQQWKGDFEQVDDILVIGFEI